MQFLNSFRYAFRGIIYCINNERNMRIHTVAALYVFAFSFFFHLSRTAYAVLFLTFAIVIMGEVFNTVAEGIADFGKDGYDPAVRAVKDMGSGSVLVGAVFAVGVGICLFWRPEVFGAIAVYYGTHLLMLAVLVLTAAASAIFIAWGPTGIRDRLQKDKTDKTQPEGKKKH